MKKKFATWLQLLVLTLGAFLPALSSAKKVEAKTVADIITSINVTDSSGNALGGVGIWENFRVNATFTLPNNTVNEGDTTTIQLPNQLAIQSDTTFDVNAGGVVVAKATVNRDAKTVTLTYTNFASQHSGVTGNFFFYAIVDHTQVKEEADIPLPFTVEGKTVDGGNVHYNGPPKPYESQIEKGGWQDGTTIRYDIAVNRSMKNLGNTTITDAISDENPGVSIDPATLKVYKLKWSWDNGDWAKSEVEEVSDKVPTYSDGNRKFSLDLGNVDNTTGYLISYAVTTSYNPADGEKFVNDSSLLVDGAKIDGSQASFNYQVAGGSAEGYTFSITLHKTNDANQPLEGAEFEVVRDATKVVVGKITTDSNGMATVDKLLKDNYTLRETKAPTGYQKSDQEIKISPSDFGANKTVTRDFVNVRATQTHPITFSKVNLGGQEIAGAQIKIYAGETATGTAVSEWTSEAGKSKELDLKPGKYTFHEEAAPNGLLKVTDIVFEVKQDGTVAVTNLGEKDAKGESNNVQASGSKLTVTDKTDDLARKVTFSKVNLGGEEIAGAQIKIYAGETATGTAVSEWTSEAGKSKELDLKPGKYTFHEEAAPTGYLAVTDITFQVNYDGSVTVLKTNSNAVEYKNGKLVITDQNDENPRKVTFSKVNLGGEEIAGAQIKIYAGETATGTAVSEWTSEAGKSKELDLKPGKYTFHEEAAPTGYLAVTDITFQVNYDGSVTVLNTNSNAVEYKNGKLVITDQNDENPRKVTFSKINLGGQEIAGAQIKIYAGETATGTAVSEWTSEAGKSKELDLKPGKYTFHEEAAPTGYLAVTDITFQVNYDGSVTVLNTNSNAVEYKNGKLVITDQNDENPRKVTFSKVNLGGEEIAGAQIKIYAGETATGTAVSEWTSEAGKSKELDLKPGKYTFHEEAAPTGYLAVTDITFQVNYDGSVTVLNTNSNAVEYKNGKLVITDQNDENPRKVTFSKVNLGGQEIAGAQIKIYAGETATGTAVSEWTSEANKSKEVDLKPGKYTFHEEAAPTGYLAVTDITFQVNYDGTITVLNTNSNAVEYKNGKLVITDQLADPKSPKDPGNKDEKKAPSDERDPGTETRTGKTKKVLPATGSQASIHLLLMGLVLASLAYLVYKTKGKQF
ncbi:cell wall anchor [Streptococcus oricebi]|uniref:Cell wall anchor n=1 Tax=Streptococcus oricebi TaxID=1547447 RepID=A0ABS5B1F8_9STRE|nr:SpaA isopeptide-forming pilin-related protein [Streptococcus oricebi]MBP2622648.1 cell wall anchor [Streptococcus oricebi]